MDLDQEESGFESGSEDAELPPFPPNTKESAEIMILIF